MATNTDNFPQSGTNEEFTEGFQSDTGLGLEKLKKHGKKALTPLVELAHRYRDEIIPYVEAIQKGLNGGAEALEGQQGVSEVAAEKQISSWLRNASAGLSEVQSKLKEQSAQELIDTVESYAQRYPGLTFSASYLSGLFLGRIGKSIGRDTKHQGDYQGEAYGTKH